MLQNIYSSINYFIDYNKHINCCIFDIQKYTCASCIWRITFYSLGWHQTIKYMAHLYDIPSSTTNSQNKSKIFKDVALKVAFPTVAYSETMAKYEPPTLDIRREALTKSFFVQMQSIDHKLDYMLPNERLI